MVVSGTGVPTTTKLQKPTPNGGIKTERNKIGIKQRLKSSANLVGRS